MFFSPTYRQNQSKNKVNEIATPDSYRDGMQILNRSVTLTGKGYRYSFNGKEKDKEAFGGSFTLDGIHLGGYSNGCLALTINDIDIAKQF
ncbi:MAG: hypothetical protein R3A43_04980 [Bacteroidia bacterium]